MARKRTIVGLFQKEEDVQRLVDELERAGFSRSDISVIRKDPESPDPARDAAAGAAIGAGAGAMLGGGLGGLLATLAGFAIPGVGPLLGVGPLVATIISGAAIGATAGSIAGALAAAGVPEDEAKAYSESVHRGLILVTLAADKDRVDEALRILAKYDTIDVRQQAQQQRERTTTPPRATSGTQQAGAQTGAQTGAQSGGEFSTTPIEQGAGTAAAAAATSSSSSGGGSAGVDPPGFAR